MIQNLTYAPGFIHTVERCSMKQSFLGGSIGLILQNASGSFIKNPIIAPITTSLSLPGMLLIVFFFSFFCLFVSHFIITTT